MKKDASHLEQLHSPETLAPVEVPIEVQLERMQNEVAREVGSFDAQLDTDIASVHTDAAKDDLMVLRNEADRIQHNFEQTIAESSLSEGAQREKEEKIERYRLQSIDGKDLGEAECGYAVNESGLTMLTKMDIVGLEGKKIDVLNAFNPQHVPILCGPEVHVSSYRHDEKIITLSGKPDSPAHIGVLLHELGHADQYQEADFLNIRSSPTGMEMSQDEIKEVFAKRPDVFPDDAQEIISSYEKFQNELKDVRDAAFTAAAVYERIKEERSAEYRRALASALERQGFTESEVRGWQLERNRAEQLASRASDEQRKDIYAESAAKMVSHMVSSGFQFSNSAESNEELIQRAEQKERPIFTSAFGANCVDIIADQLIKNPNAADHELRVEEDGAVVLSAPIELFYGRAIMVANVRLDGSHEEVQQVLKEKNEYDTRVRSAFDVKMEAENKEKELRIVGARLAEKFYSLSMVVTSLIERDATRRAFTWMRNMRSTIGVDLLGAIQQAGKQNKDASLLSGACERDMASADERVLDDSQDAFVYLQQALKTYGATTKEMKEMYPRGIPSVTPRKTSTS